MIRLGRRRPAASCERPSPGRPGTALQIVAIVVGAVFGTGGAAAQSDPPADFSDLVKTKLPDVVTVTSTREIATDQRNPFTGRSEEHTSELQSQNRIPVAFIFYKN